MTSANNPEFWSDAKVVDSSDPAYWDDAKEIDAPHNTVLDAENDRVVSLPQTVNAHEANFLIAKDVDGKKGFFGQENVGQLPPLDIPAVPKPSLFFRSFARSIASLPRVKAGLELSKGQALQSGERRLFQNPNPMMISDQEYDVLAPETEMEKEMARVTGDELVTKSRLLIEKNAEYIKKAGYTTEDAETFGDKLSVALGGGIPSVGLSVGTFMMTKNPMLAAAITTSAFTPQQYAESYIEADEKLGEKSTPAEKRSIAGTIAVLSAPLEFVGDRFLFKAVMGNTAVKRIAQGFIAEGAEEGLQGAVESGVTNAAGVRDQTGQEILADVGMQALAGGILGGTSSGAAGAFATREAKARGIDPKVAEEFGKYIKENFAAAHDNVGEFVDKELSPLAADHEAADKYVEIMRQFKDGKTVNPDDFTPEDRAVYDAYKQMFDEHLGVSPETGATDESQDVSIAEGQQAEASLATALSDAGLNTEQASAAATQFATYGKADTTSYDEALKARVESVLTRFQQDRATIVKGRIKKLDADVEAKLTEIDLAEAKLDKAARAGKGIKRLTAARDKLFAEWQALDQERADLLISDGKPVGSAILGKDVTVKGNDIEAARENEAAAVMRDVNAAFREARSATRQDIKSIQKKITDLIEKSGLSKADKSDFIAAVTNVQTAAQLKTAAPKIQARIESKLNEAHRKSVISEIKKTLKKTKDSGVIAIDYAKQVQEMLDGIDLTNRTAKTTAKLQATIDYMKRTGQSVPKDVLERLARLNKRQLDDVSTQELETILADMQGLVKIGKTKLRLMEIRRQRVKQKRLADLKKDTKRLSQYDLATAPLGEKLAAVEKVKNLVREGVNKVQRFNLYKNPMDVIFDILDGAKQYKGANSRIFKRTVDAAFGNYLQTKEHATRAVKDLQDKLDLTHEQMQKIGAYAALQQEGGLEKLQNSGYTEKELKALTLTPEENQMYELMRDKLDSMVPQLREIMRAVYNKDFTEVKNYFPFMTDFDAMQGVEIQDMFGDNVPLVTPQKKNVEKGFTQKRTGAGKQKIRIDAMGVFLRHVDNAAYLVEMGEVVRDLSDVAVSDQYAKIAGDLGQQAVADWLNLIARKGSMPGNVAFIDTFRRNAGAAVLGFKLSSVLIQPTALMDGASLVGGTHVAEGIGRVASREWREFLIKNFPEIRERAGDDQAFLDMGGNTKIAHAREAGMYALQKLDVMAASAVAIGAYTKYVGESGGKVDLNNPDPQAIQYAQLMMRRTQSSSFAKDSAPIISQGKLTGNQSIDKLVLQFQSFMLNRWSLIQHDMVEAGVAKGRTKQALNIAMWLSLANLSEYYIRHWSRELIAALTGGEPPEDDSSLTEKIIKQILGNVPVLSSLVNSAGYGSVPVPSISLLEKTFEELSYADKSKTADKKARHYASAIILISGIFGLPGALQAQQLQSQIMKPEK